MNNSQPLIYPYTGEALLSSASVNRRYFKFEFHETQLQKITGTDVTTPNEKGEKVAVVETIDPYHPDDTLKEAVELMQILERPLLLRGEPGCGKTRVAQAYAYERYKNEPEGYRRVF